MEHFRELDAVLAEADDAVAGLAEVINAMPDDAPFQRTADYVVNRLKEHMDRAIDLFQAEYARQHRAVGGASDAA